MSFRQKPKEPRTFKRVTGPLRVDGDAYGAFVASAFRDDEGREYVVLAVSAEHLPPLFARLGIEVDKTANRRVAIVKASQVKRMTQP